MSENFETGFAWIERLFAYEIASFQFIATLAGGAFVVVGLLIVAINAYYRINGEQVSLAVIGKCEEARRIGKADDAGTVAEKRGNPNIRLEFRVQTGPNIGMEAMASTASNVVEHDIGDAVPGYLFAKSKDVMSRKQIITGIKFGLFSAAFGIGFILLVNFMAAQW